MDRIHEKNDMPEAIKQLIQRTKEVLSIEKELSVDDLTLIIKDLVDNDELDKFNAICEGII